MNDENVDKIIRDFLATQENIDIDRYSPEGGIADLYFGLHKVFGERVALKFYYIDSMEIAHDEPRILRSLEHKNILKIYDARLIGKKYAYIMTPEIVGGDLQSYLNNNRLSTFQSIEIANGILLGLSELHKEPNRIVHRDLKANNIFLTKDFKGIIADFGSARRIENDKLSTRSSRYTKFYRAPESIIDGIHSFQSDIYQVGVILFQMLGGFFSLNYSDWFSKREKLRLVKITDTRDRIDYEDALIDEKIVNGKLFNLDTLPPYVDKKLKSIIKCALSGNLTKRYCLTADFMNDLYKYMHKRKSWEFTPENTYFAICQKGIKYRINQDRKGYFAEREQGNGDWRKISNQRMSLEDAIELVNEKD